MNKKILIIITLILIFSLSGCNPLKLSLSGAAWGMSKDQIISIIGDKNYTTNKIENKEFIVQNNVDFYSIPCNTIYTFSMNKLAKIEITSISPIDMHQYGLIEQEFMYKYGVPAHEYRPDKYNDVFTSWELKDCTISLVLMQTENILNIIFRDPFQ